MARNSSSAFEVATAYAVVPTKDDDDVAAPAVLPRENGRVAVVNVVPSAVPVPAPPTRVIPVEFASMPEAQDCLTWEDDYFDGDESVVAAFDLDYDLMVAYYSQLSWTAYGISFFIPSFWWMGLCLGVPCYINKNVEWAVRSQHVAITRDGVRFVQEKRKTLWGTPCTDAGTNTKTIPFDQITDCKVVEAAGHTCGCIQNTLHMISIDTAGSCSSNKETRCSSLSIMGLQNPQAFQKLLWAMKRHNAMEFRTGRAALMLDRGGNILSNDILASTHVSSSEDVATLLRDIRDELRRHNAVLQNLSPTAPQPSESAGTNVV